MKVRVITAIIGIIAVLGLVYLGGWSLTGAIFLVSLLALLEYDKMLKHFGVHIYLKATAIATAVMVLASGFYSLKAFLAAIFLAFVLLLYLILGIKKENMTGLIYSAFGAVYLAWASAVWRSFAAVMSCSRRLQFPWSRGFSSFFSHSFAHGRVILSLT